jgi:hypothetical protein
MNLRTRAVPIVLVGGLVLAGGGAVIAASGGSSSHQSAAKTQYCPNGKPKPPKGNCGHKPPKHHHKKPKYKVHRRPSHRCYRGHGFKYQVSVANVPKGRRVYVYRDGHRIKRTKKHKFTVWIHPKHQRAGRHKVTFRVRGSDGKVHKKTVHYRVCKRKHKSKHHH